MRSPSDYTSRLLAACPNVVDLRCDLALFATVSGRDSWATQLRVLDIVAKTNLLFEDWTKEWVRIILPSLRVLRIQGVACIPLMQAFAHGCVRLESIDANFFLEGYPPDWDVGLMPEAFVSKIRSWTFNDPDLRVFQVFQKFPSFAPEKLIGVGEDEVGLQPDLWQLLCNVPLLKHLDNHINDTTLLLGFPPNLEYLSIRCLGFLMDLTFSAEKLPAKLAEYEELLVTQASKTRFCVTENADFPFAVSLSDEELQCYLEAIGIWLKIPGFELNGDSKDIEKLYRLVEELQP